ncbi:MAG: hypothetical protein R3217_09200 [Gammaproteobacteria bacterium]|nr:hypothetical protein [Gammaproteobacteria bacterium]
MTRLLLITMLGSLLSACIPSSAIQPVTAMDSLGQDSILLVGKLVLDPPLKPEEQELGMYEEYRNTAILATDTALREVGDHMAWGDLKRRIEVPFDETFMLEVPREDFYILKGWVMMDATKGNGSAPLHGQFRIDVQDGDRAVYIGTLHYTRNTFFRITDVRVKDESRAASSDVRVRLGSSVNLRKSLAQPLK